MEILFWLSLILITYVYFGYPAIIYLLSILKKRPNGKGNFSPQVSIILSVYNEEGNIESKIENLMQLDYPKEKIEVLIGSDGSTDKTNEIVSGYVNEKIKLIRGKVRRGKPSMLNALVPQANGEILVFTDARQKLDKDSLRELVKNFADNKVGSVSAELVFEGENKNLGEGIGIYWKYEKFIRHCESKIGSMLGATGALYAIRRELFSELPRDLILDDVYIPLKAVERGYRALFEPEAKIYDEVAKSPKSEFMRKARTLAGNFQVFMYLKGLFNPFKSPIAWQLFSHKFLRLIVPFLLLFVFISNIFLIENYFYKGFLILQFLFYSLAIFGLVLKNNSFICDIPCKFCLMNSAAVVGLYRFLTKKQEVKWEKA